MSCSNGGEITVVDDPPDGETFVGRALQIRSWFTAGYDEADQSLAPDSYNHPATYYGGRKVGNLVSIGSIARKLSTRFSSYLRADVSLEVSDESRLLSTLEADPDNEHWANREGRIYLASPETIAAAGTPHTLFRGIWRGHESDGLSRSLTLTDILGSEFSDFNLEGTIPSRLIAKADFPNVKDEVVGKVVPIAYGKLSDRNIQTTEIGTTLPVDNSYPAVSNNGASDIGGGSLNGRIWVYIVGVKAGVEGPIVPYVGAGTVDYNRSVLAVWDRPVGDPTFFDSYDIYFVGSNGGSLDWGDWSPQTGVRPGSNVAFVRKLTHTNVVDPALDGWAVAPWAPRTEMAVVLSSPTDGADAMNGVATSSVDLGKGPVAPKYMGVRTLSDGDYHEFLLCGHPIQHVEEIYLGELPQNLQTNDSIAGSGAPWKIPGYGAWIDEFGTTPFRVINGHTYTLLYGKVGQPGPDRAAGIVTVEGANSDAVPFTVSFCAIEDLGTSLGSTITNASRIAFHLLEQWVLNHYDTGTWAAPSTSDDGIPWLNSASFAATEALEIAQIGGEGYQGIVYLDEPVTVRTLLGRMFESWGLRFGQNQHGQVIVARLDSFADLTNARRITDVQKIVDKTSISRKVEELENQIVYDWKWRPANNQFEVVGSEVHSDQAIADNRGRTALGDKRSLSFVRDEATALDVAGRELAIGKYPPRYVEVTCTLHELAVKLGDIVLVTDVDGIGATGWVDRPLWVLGITTQLNKLGDDPTIKLFCMDVYRFLGTSGVMGDRTTLLPWTDETAENRSTFYFMADRDSGRFSDGAPAKGMR